MTKQIPANLTVLSPPTDKEDDKMCCIFPGSALELIPKTDAIFREETANLFESTQIVKNKKGIKNLVVKTKI